MHIQALQRSHLHDTIASIDTDDNDDETPSDYLLHNLSTSQQIVDLNDSQHNVAPLKGFQPLGICKDKFCEELCFPTLFYGEKRSYHTFSEKDYQTIAKWELLT